MEFGHQQQKTHITGSCVVVVGGGLSILSARSIFHVLQQNRLTVSLDAARRKLDKFFKINIVAAFHGTTPALSVTECCHRTDSCFLDKSV